MLSFNRARDEIFEIGYTMTTIRLWCAVEMNSRANDRFDFRPIYEPHSLVPRILLEEGKKKKSSKYLNVRIWSISIVIQRLFLLFFLSSFFIFKERIMGSGSEVWFVYSNSSMFSFPHCFEFPLTLICIHSFIQNSFGNGKQILIAFLDKNVEFVRTELRIEKQEKSYFWQFFVINFFVVVYELVYVKKFCSMKCSNLVVQILNCCNTSRFLFRIFSRF